MRHLFASFAALALVAIPLGVPAVARPAQTSSASHAKDAGEFIDTLADQAFAILRDKTSSRPAVRTKFRQMLRENFAINEIGARLIRRHRAAITPAQYNAYMTAFPDYVVNTYADRLYDYADSDLKVVRTLARPGGTIDVFTRITAPNGGSPIDAIWSVKKAANGRYQIANLTVAGVNLALTQEADFNAYIERKGFDELVAFMRASGNKA